jgi:hypothetical protein
MRHPLSGLKKKPPQGLWAVPATLSHFCQPLSMIALASSSVSASKIVAVDRDLRTEMVPCSRLQLGPCTESRALSAISAQPEGEACMRAHYIIAVVAVIVIGFGAKLFFFSVPIAEADTPAAISIQELHSTIHMEGLPIQAFQAY